MTTTTISGTYLSGITLNAAYSAIASGAQVTSPRGTIPAVYGPAGKIWTVSNQGSVAGAGGYGIALESGGDVTNAATGLVSGYFGVFFKGALGSVDNSGTIAVTARATHGDGIALMAGGTVVNESSGLIQAYRAGIYVRNGIGTVTNAGTITVAAGDTRGDGVALFGGGSVTNTAGAVIQAYHVGVYARNFAATVTNAGTITGATRGIVLLNGGLVSNAATGTISGATSAVYLENAAGTVINAGTINGSFLGIYSLHGGVFVNAGSGLVTGSTHGILVKSAGASVTNAGSIQGGVYLNLGGSVSNVAGGLITGGDGVFMQNGLGTVTNGGSISGSFQGIYLYNGGLVTNAGSASISGGGDGVYIRNAAGTVINTGNITGGLQGVYLYGGSVTNSAGGTITGVNAGVSVENAGATVINNGTITASAGPGVSLVSGGGNKLVNTGAITGNAGQAVVLGGASGGNLLVSYPGAVFTGSVVGNGPNNTLELASAASIGVISGLGSKFTGFNTIVVDAGAQWSLYGSNTIAAGTTLIELGTLSGTGTLENDGTIITDPSTIAFDGVIVGSGTINIGAGSNVTFNGGVSGGQAVNFVDATGTLALGQPGAFLGSVTGFQAGDAIQFTSLTNTGSITAGVDAANHLTLSSGGTLVASIQLAGPQHFSANAFNVTSQPGGTTSIAATPLCFLAGTQISTPCGEVPVEKLQAGDTVLTASGAGRRIVWIGTGQVLATRGRRSAATPVIVRKNAIADGVPNQDLRITRSHSLYFDDVLIPVEYLVNHRSILWDDLAREVSLYHVELETHDVLLANGALAESYRDDGNRWLFQNANTGWDFAPQPPCLPVVTGGAVVDAVWKRLLARSGPRPGVPLTDDPDLHLVADGRRVDSTLINGTLHMFDLPRAPKKVRITSRAGAPQELGLTRDPRCLGVSVHRIVLMAGGRLRAIEADDVRLVDGFHGFEPDAGLRWTDGDAKVPEGLFDGIDGPVTVILQCAGSARYVEERVSRQVA